MHQRRVISLLFFFFVAAQASSGQGAPLTITAGIIVQTAEQVLSDTAALVSALTLSAIDKIQLPDVLIDQINLTSAQVKTLKGVQIELSSVPQSRGIRFRLGVGRAEVVTSYALDVGLLASEGKVRMLVNGFNLTLVMGADMMPSACEASIHDVRVVFTDRSWSGALLNSARFTLTTFLMSNMGTLLCPAINQFMVDFWNATVLIQPEQLYKEFCADLKLPNMKAVKSDMANRPFGVAFDYKPHTVQFTDTYIAWPVQLTITYRGKLSPSSPVPVSVTATENMITTYVNEDVVNSLLYHVHHEAMATMEVLLDSQLLPKRLQLPFALLCWSCEMNVHFTLADTPRLIITPQSSLLELQTSLVIRANNWLKRFVVVSSKTRLQITADFRMSSDGRLTVDFQLYKINVIIERMTFRKLLGHAVKDMTESVVKKKIWPKLVEKYRATSGLESINFTNICGIQLSNVSIQRVDGALRIGSDYGYDRDWVVQKIGNLIIAQ